MPVVCQRFKYYIEDGPIPIFDNDTAFLAYATNGRESLVYIRFSRRISTSAAEKRLKASEIVLTNEPEGDVVDLIKEYADQHEGWTYMEAGTYDENWGRRAGQWDSRFKKAARFRNDNDVSFNYVKCCARPMNFWIDPSQTCYDRNMEGVYWLHGKSMAEIEGAANEIVGGRSVLFIDCTYRIHNLWKDYNGEDVVVLLYYNVTTVQPITLFDLVRGVAMIVDTQNGKQPVTSKTIIIGAFGPPMVVLDYAETDLYRKIEEVLQVKEVGELTNLRKVRTLQEVKALKNKEK